MRNSASPLKMLNRTIRILLLVFCFASPSYGQSFERVLIPVAIGQTPGSHGSIWTTELWVHNAETGTREVDANPFCVTLCPPRQLEPGRTSEITYFPQPAEAPGLVAYVERPSEAVTFNLRVRDLSRQAQTWGTEIPVIGEEELLSRPIQLLNVPVGAEFRHMLRLYSIDNLVELQVRIRVFRQTTNETLGETTVQLEMPKPTSTTPVQYKPRYAQVPNLLAFSQGLAGDSRIGVELTPLTPAARFWAFISVTNNETQHVTTITPQ